MIFASAVLDACDECGVFPKIRLKDHEKIYKMIAKNSKMY